MDNLLIVSFFSSIRPLLDSDGIPEIFSLLLNLLPLPCCSQLKCFSIFLHLFFPPSLFPCLMSSASHFWTWTLKSNIREWFWPQYFCFLELDCWIVDLWFSLFPQHSGCSPLWMFFDPMICRVHVWENQKEAQTVSGAYLSNKNNLYGVSLPPSSVAIVCCFTECSFPHIQENLGSVGEAKRPLILPNQSSTKKKWYKFFHKDKKLNKQWLSK